MTVKDLGAVDYLVVGSGAMGLAFIDTLMTLQPSATVVLVDSHSAPGGHWNDAYDYVKLHQPSLLYGVNSVQLEGNWGKLLLTGTLPWTHQATKPEILNYYKSIVNSWSQQGRLQYFPSTRYDLTQNPTTQEVLTFNSISDDKDDDDETKITYQVKVNVKVVDAVQGECKVPKTTRPKFKIDSEIQCITPNELLERKPVTKSGWFYGSSTTLTDETKTKYVVVGCGKTGMDAIIYLQTTLKVPPSDITWIISRDVWIINRERAGPSAYHQALLNQNGIHEAAMDELERNQFVYRLDPTVRPSSDYKFPTINSNELKLIRNIDQKIRHGRLTHIQADKTTPVLHFVDGTITKMDNFTVQSTVFIHCSSPGPFTDVVKGDDEHLKTPLFEEKKMILFPLFAPPIPLSGATLAKLETARRNNTLNIQLAQKLDSHEQGSNADDTIIDGDTFLGRHIHPYYIGSKNAKIQLLHHHNLAMFLALVDTDPIHGATWLTKNNRISEFNWISKLKIVNKLQTMIDQGKLLGYTEKETSNLKIVADSLSPLQGM